ncbi:MAG: PA0069 family radical SAM protein [Pseudomonadota bacterium]
MQIIRHRASEAEAVVFSERRRGRGARSNTSGRFENDHRVDTDDGWESLGSLDAFKTTVHPETASSIIARNDSPDLSFDRSINPYRGCEHGCIYCYARPTHTYLGLSAGLDFETQIYAKTNAAARLRHELSRPGYTPASIALGAVTDPYQPVEKHQNITREILEVLAEARHPVGIVTKSHLVTRDIDLLSRLAADKLVKVAISITTLDRKVARSMEPRAATPERRLDAIRALSAAGIPTTVMVAPVVPGLTDHEMESILEAGSSAGATAAGYVTLRLPLELKTLFREWLTTDFPDRATRVINLTQSLHGGVDYKSDFGTRQRGRGPFADLIAQRFRLGLKRYGLARRSLKLRTDLFKPPNGHGVQLDLI